MAEPKGRPKTLVRRHILEVKEDTREWIEETIGQFTDRRTYGKTSRVIGAAIAAAGIYTMVRLIDQFGKGLVDGIKNIHKDIFLSTSVPVINFFTSIFGFQLQAREGSPRPDEPGGIAWGGPQEEMARIQGTEAAMSALKELGQFDPFAFGAALTAGGMVLAGLNPGEILKGIGSIIDALIPL